MIDGPMSLYRARMADGMVRPDGAQRAAVEKLQLLHMRLGDYNQKQGMQVALGWLGFGRKAARRDKRLAGLYMYGGVGGGKSMLMDMFFEGAPVARKRRVHFHAFMTEIHVGVHAARRGGVADPITPVAEEAAKGAALLCFDEFQVSDITDAMILGRLFEALFERGVVVVATSNRPPDDLYKDGLNRALFLPFIRLLKDRVDVVELNGSTDYRQGRTAKERRYFWPLGPGAKMGMDAAWERETMGETAAPVALPVGGRRIGIDRAVGIVGRANFRELCEKPFGPRDYLAVAERFGTFFLDAVPKLGRERNNEAKRFVTLIDAFYEARVKLYVSADAPAKDIYVEGKGAFEFQRAASRLAEMQSDSYPDARETAPVNPGS